MSVLGAVRAGRLAGAILIGVALAAPRAEADCGEVGYIATFDVKPGAEEAFERALFAVRDKVLEVEQGVLLYAPFRGDDGRYYMMERYASAAAREAHAKAPEVAALFPALIEQLAAPLSVQPVTALCRPD